MVSTSQEPRNYQTCTNGVGCVEWPRMRGWAISAIVGKFFIFYYSLGCFNFPKIVANPMERDVSRRRNSGRNWPKTTSKCLGVISQWTHFSTETTACSNVSLFYYQLKTHHFKRGLQRTAEALSSRRLFVVGWANIAFWEFGSIV